MDENLKKERNKDSNQVCVLIPGFYKRLKVPDVLNLTFKCSGKQPYIHEESFGCSPAFVLVKQEKDGEEKKVKKKKRVKDEESEESAKKRKKQSSERDKPEKNKKIKKEGDEDHEERKKKEKGKKEDKKDEESDKWKWYVFSFR